MELVGRYISIEEDDSGIKMDFQCTNKEVYQGILVPPLLRNIPQGIIRIYVHRKPNRKTGLPDKQLVLNHCEEIR